MKKPYLFFDAGGTLVFLRYEVFRREAARHGLVLDADAFQSALARLGYKHDLERLKGLPQQEIFGRRHFFRVILEELGVPPEEAESIKDAVMAVNAGRNIWSDSRPWVADTLGQLRSSGYGMSIISNTDGRVKEQLQDGGVAEFFDAIFDSKLIGLAKPDPKFFSHCCDALRLNPRECLYIGDSLAIDVRGANLAGMPAVLVDDEDLYAEWGCLRIRSVLELPVFLERYPEIHDAPGAFIFGDEGVRRIGT